MEWFIFGGVVACLTWLASVAFSLFRRVDSMQEIELDEWEGVYDAKRNIKSKLDNDSDFVKRVRDEFND